MKFKNIYIKTKSKVAAIVFVSVVGIYYIGKKTIKHYKNK